MKRMSVLDREHQARLIQVRALADGARKAGNRAELVMLYHMQAQAKDAMRPCVIKHARRDLGADFDQHEGAEGRLFMWYVTHGVAGAFVGKYAEHATTNELTTGERIQALLHQIRHTLSVRPFELVLERTPTPMLSLTRMLF